MAADVLEVIEPGALSTIQDGGRAATGLGVPPGGACDMTAWRALEALVGGAATVEMTLLGATFAVRETCVIGVTGADFQGQVVEEGRPVRPGTTVLVHTGTTLRFGGGLDGARAYLSLAGGIDVPEVLGSRSTCLAGGFGGIDGRPLRVGDVLRAIDPGRLDLAGREHRGPVSGALPAPGVSVLRVVLGPHISHVGSPVLDALLGTEWRVDPRSDRMGLRLEGVRIPEAGPMAGRETGELLSLPMVQGAVQLPPGGAPMVLLADHQTVGGYPVPLVVASVDLPRLAQLRPADRLRFEGITHDDAFRLCMAEREASRHAAARFGRALTEGPA
ncbi:MAG: biotin-dependent carboxyltransferase family protein [Chloroflexi bacterium]|nr:biotin-dependent carboxyltransferase family protein [Chloroflexota bacterium]